MIVGYDIDGVLCQDLHEDVFDRKGDVLMLATRSVYYATFKPQGDWVAITGRPEIDSEATWDWFMENFHENPPKEIYFNKGAFYQAAAHKADCINELGINLYIESDPNQVEYLRLHCPDTKVVHFASFIQNSIENMIDSVYNS